MCTYPIHNRNNNLLLSPVYLPYDEGEDVEEKVDASKESEAGQEEDDR